MSRTGEAIDLRAVVQDTIEDWRSGATADAQSVLAEYPELRDVKSLVMDLALAEFNVRTAAGDAVAADAFCERFPDHSRSLAKLLEVQTYLDRCPAFAASGEKSRWPEPGKKFLDYEVVEQLGCGGLARVYLAREPAVGGRTVVIKVSPYGGREAHTLGKLSHPNIVPIHSVQHDVAGGWTVICMPLLGAATGLDVLDAAFSRPAGRRDGKSVERVARTKRLPVAVPQPAIDETLDWQISYEEAIARIGLQLAEGLEAAHAAGISHGDLKPSNVLLSWSGRAMLLDFNLSTDATAEGQGIGGTLEYIAPELIERLIENGQEANQAFDPRCDIYSLGAVLDELLTGRLPPKPELGRRRSLEAWLEVKREASGSGDPRLTSRDAGGVGRPAPNAEVKREAGGIRRAAPDVDPRLMAIVEKCVAFDPAGRYQRASELAADLRRYLGRGARLVRMAKRHRRYVLAAAVLLVCSGGGLGAYVGTRPTRLELLYQRGLEEYEQGKYDQAAATFSQCMALRSGWPHAAFGRAQALRKAGKWRDARADFLALEKIDKGWSRAFAGYCGMRSNDTYGALSDFQVAHEAGLRDVGFLLNLARIYYRLQRHPLAIDVYTQVLSREPENRIAVRNRGMEYFLAVWTEKKRLPDAQAFLDAREDCRLNPDSFDASFCAAVIFGEAARKDPCFEEDAVGYLSKAMQQGMPLAMVKRYNAQLGSLVEKVDREVVAASERAPQGYVFRLGPDYLEPPEMADWDSFLRQHLRPLVAKSE